MISHHHFVTLPYCPANSSSMAIPANRDTSSARTGVTARLPVAPPALSLNELLMELYALFAESPPAEGIETACPLTTPSPASWSSACMATWSNWRASPSPPRRDRPSSDPRPCSSLASRSLRLAGEVLARVSVEFGD